MPDTRQPSLANGSSPLEVARYMLRGLYDRAGTLSIVPSDMEDTQRLEEEETLDEAEEPL